MGIRYDNGGGVYPNMFDVCPPVQIDGNFGCTAAIGEMLAQSHDGVIQLLPALPDDWREGRVSGLRARGGYEVDLSWKNGKLAHAIIRADKSGACVVSYRGKRAEITLSAGESRNLDSNYPAGE